MKTSQSGTQLKVYITPKYFFALINLCTSLKCIEPFCPFFNPNSDRFIKKRAELMPKLKEARRKNQRAFLRFDKLVIYDNPVNSGSTNVERASGESNNAD